MIIKKEHDTLNRLKELIQNLQKMDESIKKNEKVINLSLIEWVSPLSILPLVVYANNNGIEIHPKSNNLRIVSHLKKINFPKGTSNITNATNFTFPITRIKCGKENSLLSRYEDEILNNTSKEYRASFKQPLKFLTAELQTNIEEHSKTEQYWICAQYWPTTKTCEICIIDVGIGYKESYVGTKYEVNNHTDAIKNAIKGLSSKKVNGDERGAGIIGIMNIFLKGYGGEFIIMTGDSLIHYKKNNSKMYKLPILWNGAYICLRFKLKDINFYKYI